jgi:hypothetical protein
MNILNTALAVSGVGSGLMFGTNIGTASNIYIQGMAGIEGIKENGTNNDYASALKFTTRINGGSLTERMRITSSGSLLIGTTVQAVNTAGTASVTNFKGINAYEFNDTTGRGSTQGISWNYVINTTHIIDITPGDSIIACIDVRLAAYSSAGSGYANSLFCYGGHVGAYNITTVFNVVNGNITVSAAIVSSKLRITITIANTGLGGECVLTVTDANKNGTLSTVVRS